MKKPYRMALGYLFGAESDADAHGATDGGGGAADDRRYGQAVTDGLATPLLARLDPREVEAVQAQVARGLNAPLASSAGRLFDAVSSLLVFQNARLVEALIQRLTLDGFQAHINEQVPVNDGGVSYGQATVGAARRAADRLAAGH